MRSINSECCRRNEISQGNVNGIYTARSSRKGFVTFDPFVARISYDIIFQMLNGSVILNETELSYRF